jgi:hypothetical protein
MAYNYLSDVFEGIVTSMATCSNYEFGYWPDISNRLLSKNLTQEGQLNKYPLIILHADFKQDRPMAGNILMNTDPTIYILTRTQTGYTAKERIDNIYKLILEPIYEELLTKIEYSNEINGFDLEHTRKDLFFANVNNGNKNLLPDFLDVIEISFKSIKVFKKC